MVSVTEAKLIESRENINKLGVPGIQWLVLQRLSL
jgi:hypothetical protein